MKTEQLLNVLEEFGALSVSKSFREITGGYDNSGIIINSGEQIKGVLFSLDLSLKAVQRAKSLGFNAIVTHHPAIFGGITSISAEDYSTRALYECVKSGISVVSMHLNFDAAERGIDYRLMLGLGGSGSDCKYMLEPEGGRYGRVYPVEKIKLKDYVNLIKELFNSQRVLFYGDGERVISRTASFCGAGCDPESIAFASENGADAFVSSDFKHHLITELLARGMCVIQLTHYAAENYGFSGMYSEIKNSLGVRTEYFTDEELL